MLRRRLSLKGKMLENAPPEVEVSQLVSSDTLNDATWFEISDLI
jgi:hypothetical protein